MSGRIPNLFVVGAMRAGTTALHEVLSAHPDVFMSAYKEPAYFADPAELSRDSRVASEAGYAGNRDRYLALFEEGGSARYRGESSSHYTKHPRITGVAKRIAADSPDAHIIYLVRSPIERALSHYRFEVFRRYEHRRCLPALQADPIYCATSDYAMQITPYLDEFGAERVHIMVLEELTTDPEHGLHGLFTWLGVDPDRGPTAMPHRNQFTGPVSRVRGPRFLATAPHSAWYRRTLSRLVPQGVRDAARTALGDPLDDDIRSDTIMDYLRSRLNEPTRRFEELVGRQIEAWHSPVTS